MLRIRFKAPSGAELKPNNLNTKKPSSIRRASRMICSSRAGILYEEPNCLASVRTLSLSFEFSRLLPWGSWSSSSPGGTPNSYPLAAFLVGPSRLFAKELKDPNSKPQLPHQTSKSKDPLPRLKYSPKAPKLYSSHHTPQSTLKRPQ